MSDAFRKELKKFDTERVLPDNIGYVVFGLLGFSTG
jgi:hypothetical protein